MAIPDIKQVIDAVYTKLNADASLKALLGDGVIYSGFVVSDKASRPFVLIRPPQGFSDIGTKNLNMWSYTLQILIVTEDPESSSESEQIIDLILEDLHRQQLSTTNINVLTECTGLTAIPSSDDLQAVQLTFNIIISE